MNILHDLEVLNKYDNVLFDLDKTLFDTIHYDRAVFEVYFRNNGENSFRSLAKELSQLKNSLPYGDRNLIYLFNQKSEVQVNESHFLEFYRSPPMVDISKSFLFRDFLTKVLGNKYLVTNGQLKTQLNKIKSLNIGNFFKKILVLHPGGEFKLKPDPESYISLALKGQSVYLGDSQIDYLYAKNSGIDFIEIEKFNGK